MFKWQKYQLPNGVTILLAPIGGSHTVTVEVLVGMGAKYETKNEQGISHFLEHMAFKGTEKRPTATELNKEIDTKGVIHNAATGHESTSYFIKTISANIPWAIDVLSDIVLHPTLPIPEVKKEKGVIGEEIKMYEDNPTMGLAFDFMEYLYSPTKTGCWNITGSITDIKALNQQKLVTYRNAHMDPRKIVVTLSGDLGNANFLKMYRNLVEKEFSYLLPIEQSRPRVEVEVTKITQLVKRKPVDQGHFCLGWPAISRNDSQKYISKLLDIIIAGNTSSRLWSKIREEEGMAYYIYPISEQFVEAGFMGIQAGVSQSRLGEAIGLAKELLLGMKESITEEELARAKDYLLGKITLLTDQTDFWTDYLGQRQLLDGEILYLEELFLKYRQVTLADIKQFSERYIKKESFRELVVRSQAD